MKNLYFLLVLLPLAVFCTSCDEDDPVWGSTQYAHRIVQATSYISGIEFSRDNFTYQGNFLSAVDSYFKDAGLVWQEYEYSEITYNGDRAFVIKYVWNGNVRIKSEQASYVVRNGLMREEVQYEVAGGNEIPRDIWRYEYSGSNLLEWRHYDVDLSGGEYLDEKGVYTYQNGKLTEFSRFEDAGSGNLDEVDYTEFEYSGGVRTGYSQYIWANNRWASSYGEDYEYQAGKIVSLTSYVSDGVNWVVSGPVTYYYYNVNGDLAEERKGDSRVVYDYESGSGNARFFWYYPEYLVKSKPAIKRAGSSGFIPYYQTIRW